MKALLSTFFVITGLIFTSSYDIAKSATGEKLEVFEANPLIGGLWDHGGAIYLVFDISSHKGLWAGLFEVNEKMFEGEVVLNKFSSQELRTKATAELLIDTEGRKLYELIFTLPGETVPKKILLDRIKPEY